MKEISTSNKRRSFLKSAFFSLLSIPFIPATSFSSNNTKAIQSFSFGSCAKQWEPQPVWAAINKNKPDLFIFLGDAIYGDWHGKEPFTPTRLSLKKDWEKLASQPGFKALRDRTRMIATWDNHDYGSYHEGASFKLKEISKQLFLDFFNEPDNSLRRQRKGIYDELIIGSENQRVQFILLDTRTFRSPFVKDTRSKEQKEAVGFVGKYKANNSPEATVLGRAQWNWLQTQLNKKADLRFICSSGQVIPDQKGMDEWGVFPHERSRLLSMLKDRTDTILLTGNAHFCELSKFEDHLYELTSSGLTHFSEKYAKAPNKYRSSGGIGKINFGHVEINWITKTVRLSARGLKNQTLFSKNINFN